MKTSKNKIRVVSLFSGCGGGDLGLLGGFNFLKRNYGRLDFKITWANDIDSHAVRTYRRNIGDHIIEGDITKIKSSEIPDHDLLVGGFPCQTFSVVGQRKGFEDPRGLLYREMVRILRDKKPTAFIAENVKGLVSVDKGRVYEKILSDCENAGYEVFPNVLNASQFGVPQKRERLFIVGVRHGLKTNFEFPAYDEKVVPLADVAEKNEDVDAKYYFSARAVVGLKKANKAFNKGRAQDMSQPCNTISTHLAKVSLNGTDPVVLVKKDTYRRLTPREAARIQSFPDTFEFEGADSKQYIQIGNAIPPVLMWHVARAVQDQIFYGRRIHQEKEERDNVAHSFDEYGNRKIGVLEVARQASLFS